MGNIGYAVDLGTTTIDSCLIDTEKKTVLSRASRKNRQSLYGSDVINRIMTVTRDASFLPVLRKLALDDISEMLVCMLKEGGHKACDVDKICICGNTTMISILLMLDLKPLGVYPFDREIKEGVIKASYEFFDIEGLSCSVFLSGSASAFIGGDILAGMIYLDKTFGFLKDSRSLMLDLGTNGEMILVSNGRIYSASAACGPAFEGAVRSQGIYGNSVIDAVCMGVRSGRISHNGVIAEPFFEKGISIMNVHINMDILRQLILAKAAVRAGIDTLISYAGLEPQDIGKIYVTGGFGFCLNIKNAIYIGLLPEKFDGKISVIKNTSLAGASLLLCDNGAAEALDTLTDERIENIQLADNDFYKDKLIYHMTL